MDDRNRRPPVPLPRDEPVAQLVLHTLFATTQLGKLLDDESLPLRSDDTIELTAVDEDAGAGVRRGVDVAPADDLDDRERVRARKRGVAVVVPGDGHDRAGAVPTEHIRCCPDREPRAGE